MRKYEIAAGASLGILFLALALITETMRRQVHEGRYGNEEITPWNVRFVNDLLGQYGIWNLHKQLYQRSALRLLFLGVLVAIAVCLATGACAYLH